MKKIMIGEAGAEIRESDHGSCEMSIKRLETRSKHGQNEPGADHSVREAFSSYEIDISESTENE
jgi:hypothetical protein